MIMKVHKYIIVITLLALVLRGVGNSSFPTGFTQDEAGIGYDAYSLLRTGRDMWGESFPLALRSFGDFKMPLYTFLAIPTVLLFGLNEFAVRLPSVLFGTLSVLVTYFMVYKLSNKKSLAIWSSLFLALSPWHISLSRGAFEANLTSLFIPLGALGFLKGLKNPKWMIVSAFSFGFNLFSYHSARYFTPLVLLVLLVVSRKQLTRQNNALKSISETVIKYRWSIIVFSIFLLLTIISMFSGASRRGLDITIFNPTDEWALVSHKRYTAVLQGIPDQVARLFSNKATYVFDTFVGNYLNYFSTTFLFTRGVSEWSYGMIVGRGVLYMFEVMFVVVALYSFVKRKGFQGLQFIVLWLVIAPLPAALTKGPGFSGTRTSVMIPAIQILSAWGLVYILKQASNLSVNLRKAIKIVFVGILSVSLVLFLLDYFVLTPPKAAKSMSYGKKEVVKYVAAMEANYEKIIVSRTLSVPHIWFAFYDQIDPKVVQHASKDWLNYEKEGFDYLDQYDGYTLGKYQFGNIFYEQRQEETGTLFVGTPPEFPENLQPLKTFYYPDQSPAYVVFEAK